MQRKKLSDVITQVLTFATLCIFVRLFDRSKKFIDTFRTLIVQIILRTFIIRSIVFPPKLYLEYSTDVCITNFHIRRITLIGDFESRRVWFTDLFIIEVTSFL